MAQVSEWQRHQMLRNLISVALEEIDADIFDQPVTICISPDLSEAHATFTAWYDDKKLREEYGEDWHIEHADTPDEALEIAGLYFDLR